jgi:prevent-host-death family protein
MDADATVAGSTRLPSARPIPGVELPEPASLTTLTRMTTWTVSEAKAKLSELVERARSEGPQPITKNGDVAVVVVSAEEWERKTRRTGNLAEFFAASPLPGSGLAVRRRRDRPRKRAL